MLTTLPGFPGVVITQHMPPACTKNYAARLDSPVQDQREERRTVSAFCRATPTLPRRYAPGVERSGANHIARVQDGDPVNRHKPSVRCCSSQPPEWWAECDWHHVDRHGADGAKAMREMRDAGAYCVAQDEASCVVFGMPREAIAAGAVQKCCP